MMILQKDRGSERTLELSDLEETAAYFPDMLRYAKLSFLPEREVAELDNEKRIIYRITGLLPIRDLWKDMPPEKERPEKLFSDLRFAAEQLTGYMLLPEHLLLHPSYVFQNAAGSFYFIYVPGLEGSFEEHFRMFCEEILRLFGSEDKVGLRQMYRSFAPLLQDPSSFWKADFFGEETETAGEVNEFLPGLKPEGDGRLPKKSGKNLFRKRRKPVTRLIPAEMKWVGEIRVREGTGTLGRQENCCRYVLPVPGISREHAELRREGTQVWLMDMGSTNGTYLNGRRLSSGSEVMLQPGDEVCFGNVIFTCG